MNEEGRMKNEEFRTASATFRFFILHSSFFISRFATWREWEPNPILVRELRQAARSRMLAGMLLVLLAGLFLVAVALLSAQSVIGVRGWFMGQKLFNAFLAAQAVGGLVFIPLYTGLRLMAERQAPDLMFYTLLSESKVVRGKLSSSACLAALFFSPCIPFMAFSSLFEGVDILVILFVQAVLFAAVCLGILAAIAIASAPLHVGGQVLLGLAFTAALLVLGRMLMGFLFRVVESGVGAQFQNPDSRGAFFAALFFGIFVAGWLYAISVAAIGRIQNQPRISELKFEQPNV